MYQKLKAAALAPITNLGEKSVNNCPLATGKGDKPCSVESHNTGTLIDRSATGKLCSQPPSRCKGADRAVPSAEFEGRDVVLRFLVSLIHH